MPFLSSKFRIEDLGRSSCCAIWAKECPEEYKSAAFFENVDRGPATSAILNPKQNNDLIESVLRWHRTKDSFDYYTGNLLLKAVI